jgi:hypothetical protein
MDRDGERLDAIDALMDANHTEQDPALEQALVQLRHRAFADVARTTRCDGEPPVARRHSSGEPVPDVVALPELTPSLLRDAILQHGSLRVRRVVPPDRVGGLVTGIDRSIQDAASFSSRGREATRWYHPFKVQAPGYADPGQVNRDLWNARTWGLEAGGVWGADSPRMLFELFDLLNGVHLMALLSQYLGERPALTVDKCTFRRVTPGESGDWHQDGSFLGSGIRTVNLWIALSDCGRDAPGLDVVPTRLDGIVETGTDDAAFDWSVGQSVVARVAMAAPIVRPAFEAGDVLFFDDLFLHRTAAEPTMTHDRYAIEAWFFAPSAYPEKYVPLMA